MFYDPGKYAFTKEFQESFGDIKREFDSIKNLPLRSLSSNTWGGERPSYVESEYDVNLAWKTYVFKFFGIKHNPNLKSCQVLSSLILKYPQIVTAEFSLLEPSTHVKPHKGYTGSLMRSHLGINIPEGDCVMKVLSDERSWKEGEWLVFDDSQIHEAWNFTDEKRVVLMVDFDPYWNEQNAKNVCREVLEKTNDKFLMDIAPREEWLKWLENGCFPEVL